MQGHSADAGSVPQDGETPLWRAAKNGHDSVVRVLVEAGADGAVESKVIGRRVVGDGHMLGLSRDFGEWGQPLDEHR